MALADPKLGAEFFHAVQGHVVIADGFHRAGYQRRKTAGFLVPVGKGAQQGVGGGGAGGIVGIPGTAHAGQQLRCTGAGSPIRKARLRQPGQKLLHGQPGQPHAQQMAGGNRPQREGAKAQQKIAGGARRALAAGAFQHALPAGKYPCPKALAGKGKRRFALQLLHCGAGAAGGWIKYQFLTSNINKVLYLFQSYPAIIDLSRKIRAERINKIIKTNLEVMTHGQH